MLSLVASQAALLRRASVAPVVLVHLECFSAYGAGTVSQNYYWTKAPGVRYIWGGSARSFDPVIARLSPLVAAMEHVPNPNQIDTRSGPVELVLANMANGPDGEPLWQELRGQNLAFARVTIATVVVETQRRTAAEHGGANDPAERGLRYYDLGDYAGDEHVVRFRGELTAVGIVTATEIPLTFEAREPDLNWPIAGAGAHPDDLGLRYPMVVGAAKGIRCVRLTSATYSPSDLTLETATGTAPPPFSWTVSGPTTTWPTVPSPNFYVQIDSEKIKVDVQDLDLGTPKLTPVTRGAFGTTPANHAIGATIIFLGEDGSSSTWSGDRDPIVLIGNSFRSDAVPVLYAITPTDAHTNELTLIGTSRYSVDLNNTTLESGRTLTTISITQANLAAIRVDLAAGAAQVDTQPEFSSAFANPQTETIQIFLTSFETREGGASVFNPGGANTIDDSNLFAIGSESLAVRLQHLDGDAEGAHFWIGNAPNGDRKVARYRLVAQLTTRGHVDHATEVLLSFRFYGQTGAAGFTVAQNEALVTGRIVKSTWETPAANTLVSSVERSSPPTASGDANYMAFYVNNLASDAVASSVFFALLHGDSSYLEVELVPENIDTTRTTDVAVSGGGVTYDLVFVADVSGPEVPGSGYKASSGALVEHPADAIKWLVETFGAGTVDVSDDPSSLGDFKLAGDLREVGTSFGELLAALAYASRLSIVPRYLASGIRFLLRGPDTSYSFGASTRMLADRIEVAESRKQALERATRFRALYDLRPWMAESGVEPYQGILRIGSDQNDLGTELATEITAAELLRGVRAAERIGFPLVADPATIAKVMAYYAHEALGDRARIAEKIPWTDGYDLELGDVVQTTPPWSATAVKGRVTTIPLDPGEASIGIVIEEVE